MTLSPNFHPTLSSNFHPTSLKVGWKYLTLPSNFHPTLSSNIGKMYSSLDCMYYKSNICISKSTQIGMACRRLVIYTLWNLILRTREMINNTKTKILKPTPTLYLQSNPHSHVPLCCPKIGKFPICIKILILSQRFHLGLILKKI